MSALTHLLPGLQCLPAHAAAPEMLIRLWTSSHWTSVMPQEMTVTPLIMQMVAMKIANMQAITDPEAAGVTRMKRSGTKMVADADGMSAAMQMMISSTMTEVEAEETGTDRMKRSRVAEAGVAGTRADPETRLTIKAGVSAAPERNATTPTTLMSVTGDCTSQSVMPLRFSLNLHLRSSDCMASLIRSGCATFRRLRHAAFCASLLAIVLNSWIHS